MDEKQIQDKIAELKNELEQFSVSENAALNKIMAEVRERGQVAQRRCDNIEGQIAAYQDMLNLPVTDEIPLPLTPAPAQAETIA